MRSLYNPKYPGNDECPIICEESAINETNTTTLPNSTPAEIQMPENDIFDLARDICLRTKVRRRRLRMSYGIF